MYIVIELQTNADGAIGNIVTAFNSEEQAFSNYHAILSAAAISSLPRGSDPRQQGYANRGAVF